jgi:hypothetical protein
MLYLNNGDALVVSNPSGLSCKTHVSYADATGVTLTGGRANVSSSNTSFNAVSYSGGDTRNVRTVAITNADSTKAGVFSLLHSDGTTQTPLYTAPLQPGQTLSYTEGKGFEISSAVPSSLSTLVLPDTQSPAAPAAGYGTIFMKKIAGRMAAFQIDPSGLAATLQPNLGESKVALWIPPGNSTTVPGVFGMNPLTATGTATSRSIATNNVLARMTRIGYVSSTTAGSLAGVREAVVKYTTGAGAGLGGFFARYRFGVSDASAVSGARMFIGLDASAVTAPSNVEPSSKTNCVGVAQISTSNNLQIVYGNSSAKTPIDLGSNFPANSNTDAYELILFSPAAGGIFWQVRRLNTTYEASGSISTTDAPTNTTLLGHQLWRCNNSAALAVGLDVCGIYIETPN